MRAWLTARINAAYWAVSQSSVGAVISVVLCIVTWPWTLFCRSIEGLWSSPVAMSQSDAEQFFLDRLRERHTSTTTTAEAKS